METFTLRQGDSPLILSMPHVGLTLTPEVEAALNETGLALDDTDWWINRVYAFAEEFRPTVIQATLSRYVIDLNRDPSGASLYPGQATTGLCPTETFDGEPLYRVGLEPDAAEIARRRAAYYEPYHAALTAEIGRVRGRHGWCVLYDCHSIRSRVPRLFPGTLPTFNIGTNGGASCAPKITDIAAEFASLSPFTSAVNGRFRGGYITRHYGRPAERVHAVQMELAQSAYLAEEGPPWTFDERKNARLGRWLRDIVAAILETAKALESA